MIKADGLEYIRRGFRDEEDEVPLRSVDAWWSSTNKEAFEALFRQLVDDHGLSPMSAVDILETAYNATKAEYLG